MSYPSDLVRTKNWGTEILTDTDLEGQLDLIIAWLMACVNASTGHKHTGASNDAPPISPETGLLIASQATGDILYASSATVWARLGIGTTGQVLTVAAGLPAWGSAGATYTHPIGSIQMWAGALASPPTGWFVCDGTAKSRTTYSDLYSIIGTIYGVGDGSTTFNLPNFTNVFPYGANEDSSAGNASVGSKLIDGGDLALSGNDSAVRRWYSTGHNIAGGTGVKIPYNVMPPYLAIGFIIKY